MYIHIHIYTKWCMYIYIYTYIFKYIYIYIKSKLYIYVYPWICIYIYTYIYIYVQTTKTYIHIEVRNLRFFDTPFVGQTRACCPRPYTITFLTCLDSYGGSSTTLHESPLISHQNRRSNINISTFSERVRWGLLDLMPAGPPSPPPPLPPPPPPGLNCKR